MHWQLLCFSQCSCACGLLGGVCCRLRQRCSGVCFLNLHPRQLRPWPAARRLCAVWFRFFCQQSGQLVLCACLPHFHKPHKLLHERLLGLDVCDREANGKQGAAGKNFQPQQEPGAFAAPPAFSDSTTEGSLLRPCRTATTERQLHKKQHTAGKGSSGTRGRHDVHATAGSGGQQKAAEGSSGRQRAAEGRGQQRAAEGSPPTLPVLDEVFRRACAAHAVHAAPGRLQHLKLRHHGRQPPRCGLFVGSAPRGGERALGEEARELLPCGAACSTASWV